MLTDQSTNPTSPQSAVNNPTRSAGADKRRISIWVFMACYHKNYGNLQFIEDPSNIYVSVCTEYSKDCTSLTFNL